MNGEEAHTELAAADYPRLRNWSVFRRYNKQLSPNTAQVFAVTAGHLLSGVSVGKRSLSPRLMQLQSTWLAEEGCFLLRLPPVCRVMQSANCDCPFMSVACWGGNHSACLFEVGLSVRLNKAGSGTWLMSGVKQNDGAGCLACFHMPCGCLPRPRRCQYLMPQPPVESSMCS